MVTRFLFPVQQNNGTLSYPPSNPLNMPRKRAPSVSMTPHNSPNNLRPLSNPSPILCLLLLPYSSPFAKILLLSVFVIWILSELFICLSFVISTVVYLSVVHVLFLSLVCCPCLLVRSVSKRYTNLGFIVIV